MEVGEDLLQNATVDRREDGLAASISVSARNGSPTMSVGELSLLLHAARRDSPLTAMPGPAQAHRIVHVGDGWSRASIIAEGRTGGRRAVDTHLDGQRGASTPSSVLDAALG